MYIAGNRAFKTKNEAVIYCFQNDFDPEIMITEEEERQEKYWYELLFRSPSPGCQPKDFIDVDHNKGKWGIVAYDRELTENKITEYELKPWKGENK